jgi:putative hydrolase of the HAD superfamily
MREPRAILFDLGGTLLEQLEFDPQAGQARLLALAATNPRGASLDTLHEAAEALTADLNERRYASWIEFPATAVTRLIYERFGITFEQSAQQLELEFMRAAARMRPEPHVFKALDHVAERGLPVAVLSNTAFTGIALEDELERHGFAGRFRFVMASADYGFRKPHPHLFVTAAGRLEMGPEDIWYIGDSLAFDMAGARSAGLRTVWYNRADQAEDGTPFDAQIRDWRELVDLLPRAD